ncbi:KUP/HAK/KT family potassium transporter, partial [Gemmatimonas sp.]
MPNEQHPAASADHAEAVPERSADGTTEPPSTADGSLRHPRSPATQSGASNAFEAQPGEEVRSNTGMFPVQSHGAHHRDTNPTGKRLAILTLTALGVVYGDIGTSPLYSVKEIFGHLYGLQPTRDNVFGVLSLIVWALTLVISVKYVSFVLRADNRGEGGQFALLALIFPRGTPQGFTK